MQFPIASQNLSSKSFIELYQIEISQAELMLFFHLAQRRDWTDAHDARIHAHGSYRKNTGQRVEIVSPGEVFAREHNRSGAIRDAGRIARGDGSGFREHGRKSGHFFHRGSRKNVLVAAKGLRALFAFESD